MDKTSISRHELIYFYKRQLETFEKKGLGKKTDNGVIITQTLINATRRRLDQIRYNFNISGE